MYKMKLTTVLSAVNNNKKYYLFIPKQILFWKKFDVKFIAVYVGDFLPQELQPYHENIIMWSRNLDLNTSFVGQAIRIYYPALLKLPDDEMVMITDMDMLPMNDTYYKSGLENYTIDDFIYYRHISGTQIFICYNAAHPKTWAKIFDIYSEDDIEKELYDNYNKDYDGKPGSIGWSIDQTVLYNKVHNYPHLKVLDRPIKRLEMATYKNHLKKGDKNFIKRYDNAHFHRNYSKNKQLIHDAEKQLYALYGGRRRRTRRLRR